MNIDLINKCKSCDNQVSKQNTISRFKLKQRSARKQCPWMKCSSSFSWKVSKSQQAGCALPWSPTCACAHLYSCDTVVKQCQNTHWGHSWAHSGCNDVCPILTGKTSFIKEKKKAPWCNIVRDLFKVKEVPPGGYSQYAGATVHQTIQVYFV